MSYIFREMTYEKPFTIVVALSVPRPPHEKHFIYKRVKHKDQLNDEGAWSENDVLQLFLVMFSWYELIVLVVSFSLCKYTENMTCFLT